MSCKVSRCNTFDSTEPLPEPCAHTSLLYIRCIYGPLVTVTLHVVYPLLVLLHFVSICPFIYIRPVYLSSTLSLSISTTKCNFLNLVIVYSLILPPLLHNALCSFFCHIFNRMTSPTSSVRFQSSHLHRTEPKALLVLQ